MELISKKEAIKWLSCRYYCFYCHTHRWFRLPVVPPNSGIYPLRIKFRIRFITVIMNNSIVS